MGNKTKLPSGNIWVKSVSQILNFTYQLVQIRFSWPKFDEGCWNYHMIPVYSRAVKFFAIKDKKNGKIISDYFAALAIILPLIWLLLCFSLENRHSPFTCECSCILCPKFEKFCPNYGRFFSVGDATASPASPCRTLVFALAILTYDARMLM